MDRRDRVQSGRSWVTVDGPWGTVIKAKSVLSNIKLDAPKDKTWMLQSDETRHY